jgi:hypothetical protein
MRSGKAHQTAAEEVLRFRFACERRCSALKGKLGTPDSTELEGLAVERAPAHRPALLGSSSWGRDWRHFSGFVLTLAANSLTLVCIIFNGLSCIHKGPDTCTAASWQCSH